MSWVEIFKNSNDSYNEKTIIRGFILLRLWIVVMLADVITGWMGKDLVVNEFMSTILFYS
jgi:hypothetical protein